MREKINLMQILSDLAYSYKRFILLVLSGALTGLTLVIPAIGFIQWVTLIPVGVVLLIRATDKKIRFRSLYVDGLAFFYSYYLVCFHWFTYLYPLDFVGGMTKGGALAVVLVAWFGLSLLQALMGALVFVVAGGVCRCSLCERISILKPLLVAGLWSVSEWSQTIGWWGVPWGRLPIGQSEYLIGLQNASLFGSYFVTFVLVSVNMLLAFALVKAEKIKLGVILAVALVVFQYSSGAFMYLLNDVDDGEKIKVACIQGNISSGEKWNSDKLTKILSVYDKYTAEAAAQGAELVIWPETAVPYNLDTAASYLSEQFAYMAKTYNVYLLVGAYVSDGEGSDLNSLICFTPEGERIDNVYSKRHLVPFGEYVPLRSLIELLVPPLAELVLSEDDIVAGSGAQIIELDNGIALGGLICFDSIYEELPRESVNAGAELICLSTNDSWFSDSAAVYMHNAQAQIRAIENGKYIARAANTGISTVINSRGEVISQLDALEEGYVICDVYANSGRTLFSMIGNCFVYLLIAIYGILIVSDIYEKNKSKESLD